MLDKTDVSILKLLSANARLSLKQLAAGIPLSAPSTSERLRRLEERGVIRAYAIELDPIQLGYPFEAIVRIRPLPGRVQAVQKLIEAIPDIVECDKITGDDCFVARLLARSMKHLDETLDQLATDAATSTSIVKAQVIRRRAPPIVPL